MTITTKSAQDRASGRGAASAMITAASVVGKGPTGLALVLARRGYGLAKRETARRRALSAQRSPTSPRNRSGPSPRGRRALLLVSLAVIAAGAVAYRSRRRHELPPPADAPPSLNDYADVTVVAGRSNGVEPS